MKFRLTFVLACIPPMVHAAVDLRVDPRIELLTAVQLLADYAYLGTLPQPYRTNVRNYFATQRSHAAVRQFQDLHNSGFSLDAPAALVRQLSNPPELAVQTPYSDYLVSRAGSRDRLDRWVASLRDFAREAHFAEFYAANRGIYEEIERTAGGRLEDIDYTGVLERYHGQTKNSYTIVLGLLIHPGGFGPSVRRADGTEDVYSIIGPTGVSNGVADFGNASRLRDILWHEFGHSFANPIVEANRSYLQRFEALMGPIRADMVAQQYGTWTTAMSEHLVRAVHVRLTFREMGADAGEVHYRSERSRGFAYLDALLQKLEEYENARERYPTLASYGEELFHGLERELASLSALASNEGRVPVRAQPGVVKQRLFTTVTGAGGTLVRESRDEAEYSGQGLRAVFRIERRDSDVILSVEPSLPETRDLLAGIKYAAEADPEMRNSFGVIVTSQPDGRLRLLYVREGSRAEAFGFQRGDVTVDWSTMSRLPIDASAFTRMRDLPDDAAATIRIIRDGQPLELSVNGSMR